MRKASTGGTAADGQMGNQADAGGKDEGSWLHEALARNALGEACNGPALPEAATGARLLQRILWSQLRGIQT